MTKRHLSDMSPHLKEISDMIGNFQRFISPRVKNSTFNCLRCGTCCKFTEIILSNREINAISNHLKLSIETFKKNYLIKKEIHKTRSIFDRYNIVSDRDLQEARDRRRAYREDQNRHKTATILPLKRKSASPTIG